MKISSHEKTRYTVLNYIIWLINSSSICKFNYFEYAVKIALRIKKGAADCCKVLVGCKSDLVDSRQVTDEQIKELTDSEGLKYFETSAKLGVNVNESFMFVCKNIIAK